MTYSSTDALTPAIIESENNWINENIILPLKEAGLKNLRSIELAGPDLSSSNYVDLFDLNVL